MVTLFRSLYSTFLLFFFFTNSISLRWSSFLSSESTSCNSFSQPQPPLFIVPFLPYTSSCTFCKPKQNKKKKYANKGRLILLFLWPTTPQFYTNCALPSSSPVLLLFLLLLLCFSTHSFSQLQEVFSSYSRVSIIFTASSLPLPWQSS